MNAPLSPAVLAALESVQLDDRYTQKPAVPG